MKISKIMGTSLIAAGLTMTSAANAAIVFDMQPSGANVFGQSSLTFTSGDYTLTVTSTSGGTAALLASQAGSGLGVKTSAEAGTTWKITQGEGVVFTLADSDGAVQFSDLALQFDYSAHMFGNENALLDVDGSVSTVSGAARGAAADDSDAPFIEMSSALGSVVSFTANEKNTDPVGEADYRIIGVQVEVAAVPIPAAAWLFGSALLGLGCIRRKG
ncbi:VPLPA-CTERM sorting domain-containing protein [Pseudomonadales bacterium]|nr:VPLPA-CTERM sorting domain-containing protein [Pseudomonadales bacterium]